MTAKRGTVVIKREQPRCTVCKVLSEKPCEQLSSCSRLIGLGRSDQLLCKIRLGFGRTPEHHTRSKGFCLWIVAKEHPQVGTCG